MRGTRTRAAIAATVVGTLLVPAVGSMADPGIGQLEEQLEAKEARRARVLEEIDATEAKIGPLRVRVETLDKEIKSLRDKVAALNAEIAEAEADAREVQAKIDATQSQIDRVKKAAIQQAVTLYKAGATDTLNALLDSRSLAELDARVQLLGVAAEENTDALIKYGRLRAQIEQHYRDLLVVKQTLNDKKRALEAEEALLAKRYDEHRTLLYALEVKLDHAHEEEENLAAASRQLEQEILERSTLASVASLGKSDAGFIWPINGSITSYYGSRWGGMHTGIDIDCNTGDPLVASKAGRVIMSSSYSGYGNTIVIDHGGGYSTLYGHLNGYNSSSGQDVAQGAVIGYCGSTGNSTGSHLHFEVRVNGSPVDPLDYLP